MIYIYMIYLDISCNISTVDLRGQHEASMAITRDAEQDTHFDPSNCVEVCKARYPNTPIKDIRAAVHGPRCGCAIGPIYETFSEVDSSFCTYTCKFYENPLCGGAPSFWGVFVQYDFQAFSAHGAFDPWQKVWCPPGA